MDGKLVKALDAFVSVLKGEDTGEGGANTSEPNNRITFSEIVRSFWKWLVLNFAILAAIVGGFGSAITYFHQQAQAELLEQRKAIGEFALNLSEDAEFGQRNEAAYAIGVLGSEQSIPLLIAELIEAVEISSRSNKVKTPVFIDELIEVVRSSIGLSKAKQSVDNESYITALTVGLVTIGDPAFDEVLVLNRQFTPHGDDPKNERMAQVTTEIIVQYVKNRSPLIQDQSSRWADGVELDGSAVKLAYQDLRKLNLSNIAVNSSNVSGDFTFANLQEINLRNAELDRADLRNADLSNADLSNADLFRGILRETNLTRATLNKTHLFRADLKDAKLLQATLREANLFRANLKNADLSNADLSQATLNSATLVEANLVETDLFRANLFRANLAEADLMEANLMETRLVEVNLFRANLTGANLTGADLTIANLTGVIWDNTTCPDGTNSDRNNNTCIDNLEIMTDP